MSISDTNLRLFCDDDLSRRLESRDAHGAAEFALAFGERYPESGACSAEIGGGIAAFTGPDSPVTQAFGLGFRGEVSPDDLDALETFFESRHAPPTVEVSPYAHLSLADSLVARGYRPIEYSNVLLLPLSAPGAIAESEVTVREARREDEESWVHAITRGFAESDEQYSLFEPIGRVSFRTRGVHCFVAELEGRTIAAGSIAIRSGIALLAGAATLPEYRRRGAQNALYAHRIRYAAERGCDFAMVSTAPGSDSQRNAERRGLRVVYTRTKYRRRSR